MTLTLSDRLVEALRQAIRQHVLDTLPLDPSGELAAMRWEDALTVYGAWRGRHVAQRPRTVLVSPELAASPAMKQHGPVIVAIRRKIESGADLTAHLSKDTKRAYMAVSKRKRANGKANRRTDLDRLLADWGVHHLHLSQDVGPDGLVGRTGDLLFAVFKPERAYLIAVLPHKSWTDLELMRIVSRNWPDDGIIQKARYVLGLETPVREEDRGPLRNAGVASFLEIDGAVFAPRMQSMAGTPLDVREHVNAVAHDFWRIEREDSLMADLLGCGFAADRSASWTPLVHEEQYGFYEPVSQRFCSFGPLVREW